MYTDYDAAGVVRLVGWWSLVGGWLLVHCITRILFNEIRRRRRTKIATYELFIPHDVVGKRIVGGRRYVPLQVPHEKQKKHHEEQQQRGAKMESIFGWFPLTHSLFPFFSTVCSIRSSSVFFYTGNGFRIWQHRPYLGPCDSFHVPQMLERIRLGTRRVSCHSYRDVCLSMLKWNRWAERTKEKKKRRKNRKKKFNWSICHYHYYRRIGSPLMGGCGN